MEYYKQGELGRYSLRIKPIDQPYINNQSEVTKYLSIAVITKKGPDNTGLTKSAHLSLDDVLELQQYIADVLVDIKQQTMATMLKGE